MAGPHFQSEVGIQTGFVRPLHLGIKEPSKTPIDAPVEGSRELDPTTITNLHLEKILVPVSTQRPGNLWGGKRPHEPP